MSTTRVVGELLRQRAREAPDKLFWRVGDHKATYAEADASSDRVAAGLNELGVKKGDRVAILSTNRHEYPETIFALAKLGAIQVPLNAYLRGDFLHYQLNQSEATVALADAPGVEALASVVDRLPNLQKIVTFDGQDGSRRGRVELVHYKELLDSKMEVPEVGLSASDPISIMYTSGTTGMPKGCVLPHGYYVHMGSERQRLLPGDEDSVLFSPFPLFHGAAQMVVLMSTICERSSVVIEPEFDPSTTIERWIETGATLYLGIGAMGMALLRRPPSDKDRAHNVRHGLAIPFPPELQQRFSERFGVKINSALYGQTECWPVSGALLEDNKPGAQGKPMPYYDVQVVDDDDNPVRTGEVGEIVVRSKVRNAMYSGYWRQAEATVAAWRNLWHHTGDSGKFDEEGFLYFVDRKKDALRRRGENISSVELELAIVKHPQVVEAAVYAVPSQATEDDVMACLVVGAGETVEPEELFEFFKSSLPYFAVPRYVRLIAELPKTKATMRVQKHLLRDQGITEETWDFVAMGHRIEHSDRRS